MGPMLGPETMLSGLVINQPAASCDGVFDMPCPDVGIPAGVTTDGAEELFSVVANTSISSPHETSYNGGDW